MIFCTLGGIIHWGGRGTVFRVRKWLGGSGLGVDSVLDSGRNEFLGSLMNAEFGLSCDRER
jgi:hypothetical protein